jgi:hypothetical protein
LTAAARDHRLIEHRNGAIGRLTGRLGFSGFGQGGAHVQLVIHLTDPSIGLMHRSKARSLA